MKTYSTAEAAERLGVSAAWVDKRRKAYRERITSRYGKSYEYERSALLTEGTDERGSYADWFFRGGAVVITTQGMRRLEREKRDLDRLRSRNQKRRIAA